MLPAAFPAAARHGYTSLLRLWPTAAWAAACPPPKRNKAQEYAAQMVLGSAKLVLESGKHPGELKDAVCSPGGSTIQGVRVLEEHGLRGAVMDAVIASYNKTKEMGKG